jgi:hypothetical protein
MIPLQFWNARSASAAGTTTTRKGGQLSFKNKNKNQLKMYFDDCEREDKDDVTPLSSSSSSQRQPQPQPQPQQPWIMSRSKEKQLALDRLLGYNYQSALKLDDERMEEEILQWAIDTKVLWDGEEEATSTTSTSTRSTTSTKERCKYTTLSDLVIESSCTTPEECLASLWKTLRGLLEKRDQNTVHCLVFPRCSALWDYDAMVTVLQAIGVSRPQIGMDIVIDLFHPKYKNSPTMFSPETHSPFPTVALQVRDGRDGRDGRSQSLLLDGDGEDDAAMTRSKLEALFDSVDAVVPESAERRREQQTSPKKNLSVDKILQDCQWWLDLDDDDEDDGGDDDHSMEWTVEAHEQPFHVYATLWDVIRQLNNSGRTSSSLSSSAAAMVVAPNLDAHTLRRVAVTVNAALQKLDSRVRIVNVYHPSNSDASRNSPHAMIQLAFL